MRNKRFLWLTILALIISMMPMSTNSARAEVRHLYDKYNKLNDWGIDDVSDDSLEDYEWN